jgi:hypothetical protein
MKGFPLLIILFLFFSPTSGQVKLYFGIRGGGGALFIQDKLNGVNTSQGAVNVFQKSTSWSTDAKAELILGLGRLRLGYQFLYSYSPAHVITLTDTPSVLKSTYTTYFNSSQTNVFGNYFILELAVIDKAHFTLAPGFTLGAVAGFKLDKTSGDKVAFSQTTAHRFSASVEINAEVKLGRVVVFASPNYNFLQLIDKSNKAWNEKQNMLGGDLGLRVNMLKQRKNN